MRLSAVMLLAGYLWITGWSHAVAREYVTIGTGGVSGVYYPAGGAIAGVINRAIRVYQIRAIAESTSGSVFNINALVAGDLEFGIAQSDRAYQAWYGTDEWKDKGKQTKLRSVFSIYPEAVTLVAAADTAIRLCTDLKGKRVAVGSPGSGTRKNAEDALATCGLTLQDLGAAESLKISSSSKMLQDGRLDAYFYTVGHPNASIQEVTNGVRKVGFIPFTGGVGLLVEAEPYYTHATIPYGYYPKSFNAKEEKDVPTFGVKATLLTTTDVSEEIVYAITKEVFDNLDDFKKRHPAFAQITKDSMLEGLTAPFHPGAIKYYLEVGLIKSEIQGSDRASIQHTPSSETPSQQVTQGLATQTKVE